MLRTPLKLISDVENLLKGGAVLDIKAGTIRQIHGALVRSGYRVSENALREWIRSGKIPATYSGKTAYICYDTVVTFLMQCQMLTS